MKLEYFTVTKAMVQSATDAIAGRLHLPIEKLTGLNDVGCICPVAQSMTPHYPNAMVETNRLTTDGKEWWDTSAGLRSIIVHYDETYEMDPFSFVIVPDCYEAMTVDELGARRMVEFA